MEQSAITKKWQKLSKRVMFIGIIAGIVICIAMFTFLGVFMNGKSTATMNQMGEMFMTGIGRQAVMRYNTVIDQRTTMIDGLRKTYPEDTADVNTHLTNAAQARDFTYLAFMDGDGNIEMLYGNQVKLDDPAPFENSLLKNGETKVAVATSSAADGAVIDNGIILIGVPTEKGYAMRNGKKSAALIGGLNNDEIVNMLSEKNTDGSTSQKYDTHIIRRGNNVNDPNSGTYVMHTNESGDTDHDHSGYTNYFEQIKGSFGLKDDEADALISTMKSKMLNSQTYSTVINSTSRKHMYCERLNHSEWYLITVMEYTELDGIVRGLSKTWTGFTVGACAVILVIMVVIFGIYYYMNKQNLKQLEEAKRSAEEANKAKSDFLSNMSHDIRTQIGRASCRERVSHQV